MMKRRDVVDSEARIYRCRFCKNPLAIKDLLISKSFRSRGGNAYLFENVMNITYGPQEDKLMTGHIISEIFCCCCGQLLGWKYIAASEKSQKYKDGKFILERGKIVNGLDSEFYTQTCPTTSNHEDV